jgi:hypothetical protein
MNGKDKDFNMGFLVVCFIIIAIDYFVIINNVHHLTGVGQGGTMLTKTSVKLAPVMRGVFIFFFTVLSWNNYKNKLVKKGWLETDNARYILLVTSIVLTIIFLCLNLLPNFILIFLYPVVFVLLITSIICLIMTYNEVVLNNEEGTILDVSKIKNEKETTFVLEAEKGYINITNIFRSVLLSGGAGAGKSFSVIEPLLDESVRKGFSGICYDVKFPTLANKVYTSFIYHNQKKVNLYPVSFNDVRRSMRFNILDPVLLENTIYAEQYAKSLYSSLDTSMQKSGGANYFNKSAVAVLKGCIWWLRKNNQKFCTLPHVVQLILGSSTEVLIKILMSDSETKGFISSVRDAAEKEAFEQIAGVIGTLQNYMSEMATKEFYWVCTGNDFTLDLNNPLNPGYLILGNSLQVKSAMNPIISMVFTVSLNLMNEVNKNPSIFTIDESPTLSILDLETIPATARSNKIAIVLAVQDKSQMDAAYGKEKSNVIISNLGNQFFGNVSEFGSAKMVSDFIGDEYRSVGSTSKSGSSSESGDSSSRSVSYSEQKRKIIEPSEVMTLNVGEFVGKLVDSDINFFKGKLKGLIHKYPDYKEMEIPNFVKDFDLTDDELLKANKEISQILKDINTYRGDREINVIFVKFQELKTKNDLSNDWLLEQITLLIIKRYQKAKIDDILLRNFESIQADIDNIVQNYMFA